MSERSRVDLPQPLGPMIAVIILDGMVTVDNFIFAFFARCATL